MKHIKSSSLLSLFSLILMTVSLAPFARSEVDVIKNQTSDFVILTSPGAPKSVQAAAKELQKCIQLATGVELHIKEGDPEKGGSFISLGDTPQARAVGINVEEMSDDAYRILTKDGNLYLLGTDTPDGERTQGNGVSNGTANATYSFLEDFLGVRWLMPGEIGRDVPKRDSLILEEIDISNRPKFLRRLLGYTDEHATEEQLKNIQDWHRHHRLPGSSHLWFTHSWWQFVNSAAGLGWNDQMDSPAIKQMYKEHPEWFAMDKHGKRPYPTSTAAKFETTNPELVKWFAGLVVDRMKESDAESPALPIAPSDGNLWSESPESKALYDYKDRDVYDPEIDPDTPGMSSLVMKWYHDVAKIVAQEYPKGRVTGFIYASFVDPPQKVDAKLPSNFEAQIAPGITAGYKMYHENTQRSYKTVMDAWSKIIEGQWFYYGLPTDLIGQERYVLGPGDVNFHGATGNILPTSPDIINMIFSQALKSHINGSTIYGMPSWDSSALNNYILAKMQWNPDADAYEIRRDWLQRAYGKEAGEAMEKFHDKLDAIFRDYYQKEIKAGYHLTAAILKDVYGVHYPELEKLFLEAKAKPMTDLQKQRLQYIENNLGALEWRLRNARYLPEGFTSAIHFSDGKLNAIIGEPNPDFTTFAGITSFSRPLAEVRKSQKLPWKVHYAGESKEDTQTSLPEWSDKEFLLHATKEGDIHIRTNLVQHDAYFAGYHIRNQQGKIIQRGIFNTEDPIVIPARTGESFVLSIPLRTPLNFELEVEQATLTSGKLEDEKTLLLSGKEAPVLVLYPGGRESVGLTQKDHSVTIRNPYGGYQAYQFAKMRYKKGIQVFESLDSPWKFSMDPENNGLKRGVEQPNFDDSDWDSISPLNWWQKQNPKFADYHGVAWYRTKFNAPALKGNAYARLYFEAVDGHAEVYVNGRKVHEHILGKNYEGWDQAFTCYVHPYLKVGENTLAVKVTSKDSETASGIYRGVAFMVGEEK